MTVRAAAEQRGAIRMKKRGGLVYSTETGRLCPGCQRPVDACVCRDRSRPRSGDGSVTVSRETKGRKGAGMTLVSGLPLSDADLEKLAKLLKSRCGVGGSVKSGNVAAIMECNRPGVLVHDLDLSQNVKVEQNDDKSSAHPVQYRRPELYGPLLE